MIRVLHILVCVNQQRKIGANEGYSTIAPKEHKKCSELYTVLLIFQFIQIKILLCRQCHTDVDSGDDVIFTGVTYKV